MLNAIELSVESTSPDEKGTINIDLSIAEESIQQRALIYDRHGHIHFDTISAFIKSLRGSDPDAALLWLARMLEAGENPKYIFRRLLIAAAEDIGLADPQAIVVIESCASAFDRIGQPEGNYLLSEATIYLACAEKSNSVLAINDALRYVRESRNLDVPYHLRDSHIDPKIVKEESHYLYPHDYPDHWVHQNYLPDEFDGNVFWKPSQKGWEGNRKKLMAERYKNTHNT